MAQAPPPADRKLLAYYHAGSVARIAKIAQFAFNDVPRINSADGGDSSGVAEIKSLQTNARSSLFANWEPAQAMAFNNGQLTPQERKRALVSNFLLDEHAYQDGLAIGIKIFLLRLQVMCSLGCGLVERGNLLDIFSNMDDIRDLSSQVWNQIAEKVDLKTIANANPAAIDQAAMTVIDVLGSSAPKLKAYSVFVTNFERAQRLYELLRDSNQALKQFVQIQEICEGIELQFLLGIPIVRLEQYLIFLDLLTKEYASDGQKIQMINTCKTNIEYSQHFVNDLFNSIDARMRTAYIQEKLFKGDVFLATKSRYFVKSGPLKKVWNKTVLKRKNHQKYMFFLFNDCLVYALRPSATADNYKFKHAVSLATVSVVDTPDSDKVQNAFTLNGAGSQKSMTLYANDPDDKAKWMSALNEYVERMVRVKNASTSEEVEDVISGGRKSLVKNGSRHAGNWVEVETDCGVTYFYQLKTGVSSLAVDDAAFAKASNTDAWDEKDEPSKRSSMAQNKFCRSPGCNKKTAKGQNFCDKHASEGDDMYDEDDLGKTSRPGELGRASSSARIPSTGGSPIAPAAPAAPAIPVAPVVPAANLAIPNKKPEAAQIAGAQNDDIMVNTAPYKPKAGSGGAAAPMAANSFESELAKKLAAKAVSANSSSPPAASIMPAAPSTALPAPPPPAPKVPQWKKIFSDQYGQYYYWNEKTAETTWTVPAGYDGE